MTVQPLDPRHCRYLAFVGYLGAGDPAQKAFLMHVLGTPSTETAARWAMSQSSSGVNVPWTDEVRHIVAAVTDATWLHCRRRGVRGLLK